jgi:hypothetical protein
LHRKTNAARFERLLSPTLEPLKYQTKKYLFFRIIISQKENENHIPM